MQKLLYSLDHKLYTEQLNHHYLVERTSLRINIIQNYYEARRKTEK